MTTDYEKAINALMKDVQDLRDDMKDVVAAIKTGARSRVDDARETLHESANRGAKQVREAADAIGRTYHDGVQTCATKVGERPFTALLAALGAGVIISSLLRCHRR